MRKFNKGIILSGLFMYMICWVCNGLPTQLTFELADNDKMCFYENFKGVKKNIFNYEVLKGGNFDIDVSLTSPNRKILYKEAKRMHDAIPFESSIGIYTFCFSNEFSTISHKTIFLSLEEDDLDSLAVEAGNESPTAHTQIEAALENIHRSASQVVGYQTEYRLNEARGRFIAENLNLRVQWWSVGQSVIIFLVGFGQVFILKAFFSERKQPQIIATLTT